MADLYDRMFLDNPDDEFTDAGGQLNVHLLSSMLNVVGRGVISGPLAVDLLNLDTAAENQFQSLIVSINAATGAGAKQAIINNLESAGILTEQGIITTKSNYLTAAGIT